MNEQHGQTLIVFALVLALFFTGMLALVSDIGTLFIAYTHADNAALVAAQAGASAIAEPAAYDSTLRLDPAAAQQRCERSLAMSGVGGSCQMTSARQATADVSQSVPLPLPLSALSAPIHVRRSARPAFGDRQATVTP